MRRQSAADPNGAIVRPDAPGMYSVREDAAMAMVSARLADWLERELRAFWRAHGQDPSGGLGRVAEEWWALQRFPAIEFRDGPSGRRAALREGPDVWEVVMVARDHADDLEGLAAHFGDLVPRDALAQALAYAERFRPEIDGWIAENERVGRSLAGRPGQR
jgi:hypothetical protein